MFEKLVRWLKGEFICRECGEVFYSMNCGFGEMICPKCYDGEDPWLFPDRSYWLNRLVHRGSKE